MGNMQFDSKSFNPKAFGYMVGKAPGLRNSEIRRSRALAGNPDIRAAFEGQYGTAYARIAMRGLLDGEAVNYDGMTDIPSAGTKTYEQGVVAVGRAKAWTERDFAYDVTGVDFMQGIARQVAEYKEAVDQETLYAVLQGIFAMTGGKNQEFVEKHTLDVTGEDEGKMAATSLNTAINQACGANKKKFSLVFMHSDVATNLENQNLLEYMRYTDKNGVTRDLSLGSWNGRLVVVDDGLPVEADGAETKYTTYILGAGAISFEDIGAKVPYEIARDPKAGGGEDTLYMRQRKVFAPYGISYEKVNQASLSPTDAELMDGDNWSLAYSGDASPSYVPHEAIAIARIISLG